MSFGLIQGISSTDPHWKRPQRPELLHGLPPHAPRMEGSKSRLPLPCIETSIAVHGESSLVLVLFKLQHQLALVLKDLGLGS